MIYFFEANLKSFAVHHVGNPLQNGYYSLSDRPVDINDQTMKDLLMHYFLSPFQKVNEVFNFMHPSEDLQLNDMFQICRQLFNGKTTFIEASHQITKQLYGICNHPKIKAGELYVVLFENLQIEGELHTALGIFKSETKESYLKVKPATGRFDVSYEQEGINIDKLDKGCLIFNTSAANGYKVAVIDNSSKSSTSYWTDEFLNLKVRSDQFSSTAQVMSLIRSFVINTLDNEFEISTSDKANLLNRSLAYFKEKAEYDQEEFVNEVFRNKAAIESFENFKSRYQDDYDMKLPESFEISDPAVKQQSRSFKSKIKLDRNFHIYIHGHKELIEKGYDQDKNLNYYKVFFKEETL